MNFTQRFDSAPVRGIGINRVLGLTSEVLLNVEPNGSVTYTIPFRVTFPTPPVVLASIALPGGELQEGRLFITVANTSLDHAVIKVSNGSTDAQDTNIIINLVVFA